MRFADPTTHQSRVNLERPRDQTTQVDPLIVWPMSDSLRQISMANLEGTKLEIL